MSAKMDRIVKSMTNVLKTADKSPSPYDTQAEVVRVDGDTAWVHIAGGVDETPVKMTINAKAGDTVQVRVAGGSAWLTGNGTAPPTDDTRAEVAVEQTAVVEKVVRAVQKAVASVSRIAGNTAQYFWHTEEGTDTGVHITEIPKEEFLEDPSNGGGNLLARSNGIAVRDGLTEVATFGADGVRIGKDNGAHSTLDSGGQKIYARNGDIVLSHIGYGEAQGTSGNISQGPFYTMGQRRTALYSYDSSETYDVGDIRRHYDSDNIIRNYVCKEKIEVPEAWNRDHWSYYIGHYSHAEGNNTTASGSGAHSEGYDSKAIGDYSHAEGYGSKAIAAYSHAEGRYTVSSDTYAHAEGFNSVASGYVSHAQNLGTVAAYGSQTAIGRYNDNKSANLFEIGNGTADNARSNALEVDWSGNITIAGDLSVGGDANIDGDLTVTGTLTAGNIANIERDDFVQTGISIAANSYTDVTLNRTISGTFLGATVRVSGTSNAVAIINNVTATTVVVRLRNVSSSALSGVQINAWIIVKT